MEKRYLIDTNVIIDFSLNEMGERSKNFVSSIIDNEPYISVVNKIELLGFSVTSQDIIDFVNAAYIIGLTDQIINETINFRKAYKIKLPDAIIAASAIAVNAVLVTRNIKDFRKLDGLTFLDPYQI